VAAAETVTLFFEGVAVAMAVEKEEEGVALWTRSASIEEAAGAVI